MALISRVYKKGKCLFEEGEDMNKLVIILGLITLSFSQPFGEHEPRPFDEKDPRAIIEKVKIYRLTQVLDLTTEQAIVFFPKLNELQKSEKEFGEKKMKILNELRDLLKTQASEKEIIKTVSKFEDAQRKKFEDQLAKLKEIWEVLTPVQRAKFLIFQEDFNREIREMIKQIKKHKLHKP